MKVDSQSNLYEVDTEKLLQSNEKVSIPELWKAKPQPTFPEAFLELLFNFDGELLQHLIDVVSTKVIKI